MLMCFRILLSLRGAWSAGAQLLELSQASLADLFGKEGTLFNGLCLE
jgi:hypothetical protein